MGLRVVGPEDAVAVIVVVVDGAFCSDSVLGWGRSCQFGTVEDYKREGKAKNNIHGTAVSRLWNLIRTPSPSQDFNPVTSIRISSTIVGRLSAACGLF